MADCPEKTSLVAYLYGEDSADDHARVEVHVAECRTCSEELTSLRSVQGALSGWTVPEVDLAFDGWRTVPSGDSGAAPAARERRFWRDWSPAAAWSLGVAATLCLAVGATAAAIAGFEVRYGDFAFSVGRTPSETTTPRLPGTEAPPAGALPVAEARNPSAAPIGMGAMGMVSRPGRRETDLVLSPPADVPGSGPEFDLVGGNPMLPGRVPMTPERMFVYRPESPEALLEEIRRRMAEGERAPEPAWPDIAQRLRLAQERDPARVREGFADFIVRVAGEPGEVRPGARGR